MGRVFTPLRRLLDGCLHALSSRLTHWTKPLGTSLPLASLTDLGKSKSQLIAENALLRQQLIVLRRQVKRPTFTRTDRILLVLLARLVRTWQKALVIVQPDTLLKWHRELFGLYWKRKSKASSHQPKAVAETIALIREMAKDNRLWGAERIRGELLKLGLRVCKRTIQKYMRNVRTQQPRGQKWSTFLRTHAADIWACDAPSGHRSVLSTALCLLPHRIEVKEGGSTSASLACRPMPGWRNNCEKPPPMDKLPSI
jgi:putative transposase